jgi:hypothetical protein
MTNLPDKGEDELERLRMENEVKKMKLMLEHGAKFPDLPNRQPVDPVIENAFLNYIEAFEKNYVNAEQISLFDFIDRPAWIPGKEIPDSDIGAELDRLMGILNDKGIQLDTLCEVEEREIYRFVTEELFLEEIDNMKIPGMMTCFIYEEFHPNHEYDIRNTAVDGMMAFLNKESDHYPMHFTKEAIEMPQLAHFRDAYASFTLHHFKLADIEIRGINASADFDIDFTATIEGSTDKPKFTGKGSVVLLHQYGYWYIQMIHFPALPKVRKPRKQ